MFYCAIFFIPWQYYLLRTRSFQLQAKSSLIEDKGYFYIIKIDGACKIAGDYEACDKHINKKEPNCTHLSFLFTTEEISLMERDEVFEAKMA